MHFQFEDPWFMPMFYAWREPDHLHMPFLTRSCSSSAHGNRDEVVVQSLDCVLLFVTPRTAAHQASLSFTISQSLLKLMSIESVMPSNHLILCHPLLLLPSIFLSIRVFSNESALCIRWPVHWSFGFSNSLCNEHSELISFRIAWFDLLAVQGTLKSLLQPHSSKASTPWCSAFIMAQLSHPYMTTEKTIGLTRQTFVGKVTTLVSDVLSRSVIAYCSQGSRGRSTGVVCHSLLQCRR